MEAFTARGCENKGDNDRRGLTTISKGFGKRDILGKPLLCASPAKTKGAMDYHGATLLFRMCASCVRTIVRCCLCVQDTQIYHRTSASGIQ